jgi:hypothetical protein
VTLLCRIAIASLKRYKSPGSIQIPAELIQTEGETLRSKIHKLINSIWNKEEVCDQWKESITVPVHKNGDKIDCSNYRGISPLSTSFVILSNILLSKLIPYVEKLLGIMSVGFLVTDQLLISFDKLSDKFPIQNGRKQGDALSPLFFNPVLKYSIKKVQKKQVRLKLNGTHQLLGLCL